MASADKKTVHQILGPFQGHQITSFHAHLFEILIF